MAKSLNKMAQLGMPRSEKGIGSGFVEEKLHAGTGTNKISELRNNAKNANSQSPAILQMWAKISR